MGQWRESKGILFLKFVFNFEEWERCGNRYQRQCDFLKLNRKWKWLTNGPWKRKLNADFRDDINCDICFLLFWYRFSSCCRATTRTQQYWRKSEVVSKYYDNQVIFSQFSFFPLSSSLQSNLCWEDLKIHRLAFVMLDSRYI